jgi:Fe-S-cluster containining protein
MKHPVSPQKSCLKCGTCCQNNGPVLHLDDLELIRKKILVPENLVLLRKGEPAMDSILGKPVLLEKELIKIKGKKPGSWTCLFHDTKTCLCLIHNDRPVQCRILECWNPQKITEFYNKNTLSRRDLLSKGSALEEIILMHEEKCSAGSLMELLEIKIYSSLNNDQEIKKMISFDIEFRKIFQEKTGISKQCLDYYFGRPLNELIPAMTRFIKSYTVLQSN